MKTKKLSKLPLFVTRGKDRFFVYKNKRYRIDSIKSNEKIIAEMLKIIKILANNEKRSKQRYKSKLVRKKTLKKQNNQPELNPKNPVGTSNAVNEGDFIKYWALNSSTKIEPVKMEKPHDPLPGILELVKQNQENNKYLTDNQLVLFNRLDTNRREQLNEQRIENDKTKNDLKVILSANNQQIDQLRKEQLEQQKILYQQNKAQADKYTADQIRNNENEKKLLKDYYDDLTVKNKKQANEEIQNQYGILTLMNEQLDKVRKEQLFDTDKIRKEQLIDKDKTRKEQLEQLDKLRLDQLTQQEERLYLQLHELKDKDKFIDSKISNVDNVRREQIEQQKQLYEQHQRVLEERLDAQIKQGQLHKDEIIELLKKQSQHGKNESDELAENELALEQFRSDIKKEREEFERHVAESIEEGERIKQSYIDAMVSETSDIFEQKRKLEEYIRINEPIARELISNLEREKKTLTGDKTKLNSEIEKIKKENEDKRKELDDINDNLRIIKLENQLQTEEKKELDDKISSLNKQYEDIEKKLKDVSDDFEYVKKENDDINNVLAKTQFKLFNESNKLKKEKEALITVNDNLEKTKKDINALIEKRISITTQNIRESDTSQRQKFINFMSTRNVKVGQILAKDFIIKQLDSADLVDVTDKTTAEKLIKIFLEKTDEYPDPLKTLHDRALKAITKYNNISGSKKSINLPYLGDVIEQIEKATEKIKNEYKEALNPDADNPDADNPDDIVLSDIEMYEEETDDSKDVIISAPIKDKSKKKGNKLADDIEQMNAEIKEKLENALTTEFELTNPELASEYTDITGASSSGSGNMKGGLYNYEINEMMKKYKGFLGAYAIDQLNMLKPKSINFSFIMNTQPIKVKHGHWVAVFISPDTIEYYDSLAEEPNKKLIHLLKPILHKFIKSGIWQYKINSVKLQKSNTDTCGYFAMKFITDRYNGKTFKQATRFKTIEDSVKGEQDIKKFKRMVKDFGYIK